MRQFHGTTVAGIVAVVALVLAGCSSGDSTDASNSPSCGPGTSIFACPAGAGVSASPGPHLAPGMSPEQLSQLERQSLSQVQQPANTSGDALIAARHHECGFGAGLLRYLATGDNGGNPAFDQYFASDVGAPVPQARAIADKAIQDCDAGLDQKAADATRAAEATAAATAEAQAEEALKQKETVECANIGGHRATWMGGYTCASNTPDRRSQGGASCKSAFVDFHSDGSLNAPEAGPDPLCFTSN